VKSENKNMRTDFNKWIKPDLGYFMLHVYYLSQVLTCYEV